ncbi:MAG: dihydroxy-acid dehydratase [Steroidobacteraceae bacterium]
MDAATEKGHEPLAPVLHQPGPWVCQFDAGDKAAIKELRWPNLAIINSYNDMLSAHQPLERYPVILRAAAREAGATAQVAGGVPAMCDGITQGMPGMELSLFSRDVIAMATGVSLAHGMFDATLCPGCVRQDRAWTVDRRTGLRSLPTIFVPGGPMPSGIANKDKARIRKLFAEGKVGREALGWSPRPGSYHSAGTCTFYGTANSNQMLMEVMGPAPARQCVHTADTPLRDALTGAAARRAAQITALGSDYRPLARIVDERAIVQCGGGPAGHWRQHQSHSAPDRHCAGRGSDPGLGGFSRSVPMWCRCWRDHPNGSADVNHFHAAGGTGFLMRELLDAGLMASGCVHHQRSQPVQPRPGALAVGAGSGVA